MSTFRYKNKELTRFDHLYNSTAISERGLEIAVAKYWIGDLYFNEENDGDVLEVGNVLSHYGLRMAGSDVVDKYEVAQGVTNMDLFDIEGDEYSLIISISTLEHVGMDYGESYDPDGTYKAVEYLKTRLAPKGHLCVTIPIGWRPDLNPDEFRFQESRYYIRQPELPGWWASAWILTGEYFDSVPPRKLVYGTETPWAQAVWVGEFTK